MFTHRHRIRPAACAAFTCLLIVSTLGCGGTANSNDTTSNQTNANDDEPNWPAEASSDESQADEPEGGNDPANDGDPPNSNAEVADVCTPRPVPLKLEDVPTIPDRVRTTECSAFELSASKAKWRDPHTRVVWKRRGDRLTKLVFEKDYRTVRTRFHLDESGEVRKITRRNRMDRETEGGTWQMWRFNDEGRLVEKSHVTKYRPQGDGVWDIDSRSRTVQTWKNGRLVERVVTSRTNHDRDKTRFNWSYDNRGRMTIGSVEAGDQTYSVHWSYGDSGPTRVEHRLDGRTIAVRTWTYRSSGHLEQRRVQLQPDKIEWPDLRSAINGHGLDQYEAEFYRFAGSPHRSRSEHLSEVAADGECRDLPASVGFGYPTDRPEYRLVWEDRGEFDQIRELPYLNGRQYYYGALPAGPGMWFGHRGSMTHSPAYRALRIGEGGEIEIRYDERGRMVEQSLHSDGQLLKRRTRSFEGNGLRTDRVEWNSDHDDVDRDLVTRTLRFERNGGGQMTRRTLIRGGERLGYQTFRHDESGAVDKIELILPSLGEADQYSYPGGYPKEVAPEDLRHVATYRRELDDEGRTTRFTQTYFVEGRFGHRDVVTTFAYGPHGLVDRSRSPLGESDTVLEGVRRSYDEHGQLTEEFSVRDGSVQRIEKWAQASDGRLLRHRQGRPDGGGRVKTVDYQCVDADGNN